MLNFFVNSFVFRWLLLSWFLFSVCLLYSFSFMGETIKYHQITDSLKTNFFVAGFCLHTSKRAKIFKIKLKKKKMKLWLKWDSNLTGFLPSALDDRWVSIYLSTGRRFSACLSLINYLDCVHKWHRCVFRTVDHSST